MPMLLQSQNSSSHITRGLDHLFLNYEKSHALPSLKFLFLWSLLIRYFTERFPVFSHLTKIKVYWTALNSPAVDYIFPIMGFSEAVKASKGFGSGL